MAGEKYKYVSSGEEERNKGKRQSITFIIGGSSRESKPSKIIMNKKIVE